MTTLAFAAASFAVGMAAMYIPARLARYDAAMYNALAEDRLTLVEARDAAFEETRNRPWYWSTDPAAPAIEAAPAEHEAEVLAVAYPTQELRTLDPQVAVGLARLADEVGLVQALSDRPADDEDVVGDEQPGEAWFARIRDGFDDMARGVTDAINWPIRLVQRAVAAWRRRRDERHLIGSGEQATDVDPFAELLAHVEAEPLVLDIADEAELDEQRAEWVALNPPANLGPDGQRHWNDVTAMHEVVVQGRHRKMPINVPAQRTGDEP
jgi:hypothetical protein